MVGAEENSERFDLFSRFIKKNNYPNGNKQEEEEEDVEIELSLGLSLNGRFGVDPTVNKKLKRSSTVANLLVPVGGDEAANHAPLWRTQSLPTETEEELRLRKEMQATRRMEARKKRMVKLKNSRVVRDKEINVLSKDVRNGKSELDEVVVNGDCNGQRVDDSILRRFQIGDVMDSSQGSIGAPPRSGSSGSSDLIEGSKPNQIAHAPPPHEQESTIRAPSRDAKAGTGILPKKNGMFDMPYVTTKEAGPNGVKIEGFLYKYKKGEEVRIMCVCHGSFLTPKEFVAHGGGGEVEQPLKHIVVSPYPLF